MIEKTSKLPPLTRWLYLALATVCLLGADCLARTESEARAECIAGCLTDFKAQVSARLLASLQRQPESINAECSSRLEHISSRQDLNATRRCQTCAHTCNHFATKSFESDKTCKLFCQRQHQVLPGGSVSACQASCRTVRRLLSTNQGSCPAPDVIPAGCQKHQRRCQPEQERQLCHGLEPMKCCAGACGASSAGEFVCAPANISIEMLPEVPPAPTVARLQVPGGAAACWASWDSYRQHRLSQLPVVFLIQYRSYQGHEFREVSLTASRWQSLAVTTRTGLRVEEAVPGRWYQFRLAAVSSAGHHGYSEPSAPVKPGGEPSRPGQVRRLAQGVSRLRRGEAVVDVRISWRPPEHSDLPLDKYKIKWTETLGQSGQTSLTKFETHVPWTQTEFTLPDLKLDTAYLVTVWAIAHYDDLIQLSSKGSSIHLATMQLPPAQPDRGTAPKTDSQQPSASARQCSCLNPPVTPVSISSAYWEAGDLRLPLRWPNSAIGSNSRPLFIGSHIIKWTQRVCIESKVLEPNTREAVVHNNPSYTLTGLRFNCQYSLQIRGLSETGDTAVTWDTCFCTRSCRQTGVKGDRMPQCPPDEEPQPPASVQISLLRWQPPRRQEPQFQYQQQQQADPEQQQQQQQQQKFYAARVSWESPASPVRAYRIAWAPRVVEDVSPEVYGPGLLPRMDASQLDTRVLDAGQRHCLLPSLRPGQLYIVSLQAVTEFGDSRPRIMRFLTPQTAGNRRQDQQGRARHDQDQESVQKYIHLAAGPALHAVCARLLALCVWASLTAAFLS
ncbi:hypothetical protein BOX15_Mlig028549g3 [Macrostomum lignano]|uniref:Fibronectin type-III domain-containing protein n=1 Tax=Macrostomum lignano TaxID=282301 RepID=A0A267DSE2_9PLAT|nr:hypothetical protein BOX15_Mlig028549g3 [Macrostomum lignano]